MGDGTHDFSGLVFGCDKDGRLWILSLPDWTAEKSNTTLQGEGKTSFLLNEKSRLREGEKLKDLRIRGVGS